MSKDFSSDFKAERKIIQFSILAEIITVILSVVALVYFNQTNLGWVVLVGLLAMLIGLIVVGSYLWLRFSAQPEVEEKESLSKEKEDLQEKLTQTRIQIGRLEEERVMIDRDEQSAIANRNEQFQNQIRQIAEERGQVEITFRQTLQQALQRLQSAHIRDGLVSEKIASATIPGIESDQLTGEWRKNLATVQIMSANDVIPELLAQSGLDEREIQALQGWRNELEAEYRSTQPTDIPQAISAPIREEYEEKIGQLEKDEIIAKAALEKDFFEIREYATKQRERNKSGLSVARSTMRGLEERQKAGLLREQTYTTISFRHYFIRALSSALSLMRVNKSVRAGIVNLVVVGLVIAQGTLSIQAMRKILSTSSPIEPLQNETATPSLPELACLPTDTLRQTGVVTRVVDGDTIDVEINGQDFRVRYIGVDTPEPDQYYGGLSMNRNIQLVAGKEVTLIQDVSDTDSFGRLLRFVLVGDIFVNYQLVFEGDARASAFPPDIRCKATFESAQEIARTDQAGMWQSTALPVPTETSPTVIGGTATFDSNAPPCSCTGNELNCSDFDTQNESQACLDHCITEGAGDIHRLDGNGDGQACESLP